MQLSPKETKLLQRVERITWQRKFGFVAIGVLLILMLGSIVYAGWIIHTKASDCNISLPEGLLISHEEFDSMDKVDLWSAHILRFLLARLIVSFILQCFLFFFLSLELISPVMLGRRERLIRKLSGRLRELGELGKSA